MKKKKADLEDLTEDSVKALVPDADKAYERRDGLLAGLIVRVQPTGLKTFYLQYRDGRGKTARIKLGRFPILSVVLARKKAKTELARVTLGADPAAEKRKEEEVAVVEKGKRMTLRTYIEEVYAPWYRANRRAAGPQIQRILSGFAPLLNLPLTALTREHFIHHRLTRMQTPIMKTKLPSAATLNRCNATLRPALEMAVRDGIIPVNPLAHIGKTKDDKNREIRTLTAEEEKAIMAVFTKRREERVAEVAEINERRAAEGRKPIPAVPRFLDYFESMFIVSLESGIRRGEAFSLRWENVDLDGRKLTVRGAVAKSSQTRVVPLTTRAHGFLTDWKAQTKGEGLVWPSRIGGGQLGNINGAWRQLCKDAKITGLRWHDLRHSYGSRCAMAGVPLVRLQKWMGHSVIGTTMIYVHSNDDNDAEYIGLIEAKKQ